MATHLGADDLLPMVIFVVIKAQPQTWWSDIRFVMSQHAYKLYFNSYSQVLSLISTFV